MFKDFVRIQHNYPKNSESYRRIVFLNSSLLLASAVLLVVTGIDIYKGTSCALLILHIVLALLATGQIFFINKYKNFSLSYNFFILYVFVALQLITYLGVLENIPFVSMMIFPSVAFYFSGSVKKGLLYAALFYALIMVQIINHFASDLPFFWLSNLTATYIFISFFSLSYSKGRNYVYEAAQLQQKHLAQKVELSTETLKKQNEMLIQQSKMASMGELLASVSHQWKQPLSAIATICANEEIRIRLEKEINTESFQKIQQQVTHMEKTLNSFTNFYSPSQSKNSFILQNAIDDAILFYDESLSQRSIVFKSTYHETIEIESYEIELQQIILNLISNSIRAFSSKEILSEPYIQINVTQQNNQIQIQYTDNAGGIDPKILDTIFDAYVTTKDKHGGLGMYMSQKIIQELFHGTITAENTDDGACFTISFSH